MAKVISEGVGEFYQHYPRVACVVTAHGREKDNAMAAAWHSVLSMSPPIYGVAISTKRFTYQLIIESKQFGVNFLPYEAAELIASVGGSSGHEIDKFQRFNIAKDKPVKTTVPILMAAYAAYECQLVDDKGYGDHRWLVGEIVAVHMARDALTPEETLDLDKISPTMYLGGNFYCTAAKDTRRYLDREVFGKR